MSNRQEVIRQAAVLSYEQDRTQVVGLLDDGQWVVRDWEDPESLFLKDRVLVGGDGEIPNEA